ncbi:MAG TPA: hypothetical protein VNZ52_02835 [Candidatus Thermoplasmatota archaeon]|nr:hypothetical protein [Candidatus Thermoplasmatota archaeon]
MGVPAASSPFRDNRRTGPAATDDEQSLAGAVGEVVADQLKEVDRREVEEFLSQAVKLLLQGGFRLHHDQEGWPGLTLRVTPDTLVLDLTHLARAVQERRVANEDEPGEPLSEAQVLDRWRVFVKLDGETVAALGRGIPGVQVRRGRAAFILMRDAVRGWLGLGEARPRRRRFRSGAPNP